ncbi:MAG TPA: HD domain-containing protein, partial [Herpetosiphonaceae bacterium]|nr:HD domain-containing protein [Herpetosiphonaceae bacterium]
MNKRDEAQIEQTAQQLSQSAADELGVGPRERMREAVAPKIEAAVEQREAEVAELTSEPVQGEPAEVAQADPGRVTITDVRKHPHAIAYLKASNASLKLIGYTEHGRRHAGLVGHIAANVLRRLDFPAREIELAEIAGYLHDIGNCINREQHGQSGAILAKDI